MRVALLTSPVSRFSSVKDTSFSHGLFTAVNLQWRSWSYETHVRTPKCVDLAVILIIADFLSGDSGIRENADE